MGGEMEHRIRREIIVQFLDFTPAGIQFLCGRTAWRTRGEKKFCVLRVGEKETRAQHRGREKLRIRDDARWTARSSIEPRASFQGIYARSAIASKRRDGT